VVYRNSHEAPQLYTPGEITTRDFKNEVSHVKTINIDDRLKDQDLIYYTDIVQMTNDIRYIVTYNTILSAKEARKDPANRQYAGSDVAALEGTAWVTKFGKFYKDRHDVQALEHHRPSIIVGVQQNYDRFNNLHKTTKDMLAIHAFYAATLDYDQENLTTIGTSRGGMLALLIQLLAERYGKRVLHSDAMVPCIPTPLDAAKMFTPINLINMIRNEKHASKDLGLSMDELLEMADTLDILTLRGIVQQLKEGLALAASNISTEVSKSRHTDHIGDITVQKGDNLSFATKWPKIFRDHTNMVVDVRGGGGHASSIGKTYFNDAMNRQESVAAALHADPAHRRLGGRALRNLIDQHNTRHQAAV